MDESNPLGIKVFQTIFVVEGSPSGPPDPWVAALPEVLGTPTLLQPRHGLYVDWDRIAIGVSRDVRKHEWANKLGACRLVELLRLPDGSRAALVEWTFERCWMTGHAGSGEERKESRGLVALTESEADELVESWKVVMSKEISLAEANLTASERTEYACLILKEAGLDEKSIRRRRNEVLTAAGLDHDSIVVARTNALARLKNPPHKGRSNIS